jgi:iron complex outermembrane recepter protein
MKAIFMTVVLALLVGALPAGAATIDGVVKDASGDPVAGASITLVDSGKTVKAGSDGAFRFEGLAAGHYHLLAESRRLGSAVIDVDLNGGDRAVTIVLDPTMHAERIVVTGSVDSRRASEVYQPVSIVDSDKLLEIAQPTLGETLATTPGVSSSYFGPGSSRPVIRGLGGDRVRILEEGIGTGDASGLSPDHAVALDPSMAGRIEILRGPATLLYGSSAVGGVVNVVDGRVPSRVPTEAVTGTIDLGYGSAAEDKSGSVRLDGGQGSLAWRLGYAKRSTSDYEIPGPAEADHDEYHDEEDFTGVLENSDLESENLTAGLSWIAARGFLGVSWSGFDTNYGVPGHAHHDDDHDDHDHDLRRGRRAFDEDDEEELVRIDLRQRRVDFAGEYRPESSFFRTLRFRLGTSDYEHTELEGDEIGTRFFNDSVEGRIEAIHRGIGAMSGSFGLQYIDSDFEALGEEAFVPPSRTESLALFAFEEWRHTNWDFQVGARWETQDVSTSEPDLPSRSFDGVSVSMGSIWRLADSWAVAVSLARTERLPNATELYANGPHIATRAFEIGDPTLGKERNVGLDISLRKTIGRFHGEINVFQNDFDGYIFEMPTGEVEDGLDVFQFVQQDARFQGVEIDTHTEIFHSGETHFHLELGGDYVHAKLKDGGYLPRISPVRFWVGFRYRAGPLTASAELRRVESQSRVAEFEEETHGYTMLNATAGYRIFAGRTAHDILLRGTNLTDELARSHVSPLKDVAPLPGRDFRVAYRVMF